MSALAEALVAAQRRAVAQLEKEFVRSRQEDPDERAAGLRGALPSEPTNGVTEKPSDKATDAQLTLIAKLVKEKNVTGPDQPLTKQDAHEIIDTLKAGTYDPAKWSVPF